MRFRFHSITFLALFLGFFCVNTFILHQPILGCILLVLFLVRLGTHPYPPSWKTIWIFLSLVMILSSASYYLAFVPALLFQGIVLGTVFFELYLSLKKPYLLKQELTQNKNRSWPIIAASVIVLFLLGLFFQYIQTHPIVNAIRSPWDQIPPSLLLLFFIAAFIVSVFLYRGREKKCSLTLFLILIGSLLSFAAIAYPIGYGFDSFIHKATELHLAEFGTITPKPFYYIGQYSIVLFFSHAFSLPVDLVDTWLLPILATILLPLAWLGAANIILKKSRYAPLTLLGLFLLPLDAFIVTTPQGLGNLWILLAILASVPWLFDEESPNWIIATLATISTMLIHPIAGIPLFFFFALLFFSEHHHKLSDRIGHIIKWLIVIGGSLALPASFVIQSFRSGQGLHLLPFSPSHLLNSTNFSILFQSRFSPLLDFVYLYGQNMFLLVLGVSAVTWWMYRNDLSSKIRVLFLMLIILGANYLLLANVIDFSFLIDYERANYANRLIPLILFFASPFLILAFGHLSMNLRTKPIALKFTCLVLLTMIATTSFYLAFPRRDAYANSHAFNTSQADVDAVHTIEEWSDGKPYIVLANQSVSAVAIKDIGFRYYGNLFFYPIPTGETMYQKFLAMNDAPNKSMIEEARALIPEDENVHTVYYVVNTYWWQSERIIEQTKSIADDWKSVGGSVYVFRFDLK